MTECRAQGVILSQLQGIVTVRLGAIQTLSQQTAMPFKPQTTGPYVGKLIHYMGQEFVDSNVPLGTAVSTCLCRVFRKAETHVG